MLVRSLVKPFLFTCYHIRSLVILVIICICYIVFLFFRFEYNLFFPFRFTSIIHLVRATSANRLFLNCLLLAFVICMYLYCLLSSFVLLINGSAVPMLLSASTMSFKLISLNVKGISNFTQCRHNLSTRNSFHC